jgi:hypothetical protein
MKSFTEREIKNFRRYEKVRSSGLYNMLSPQARVKCGLDQTDFINVQQNYTGLKEASEAMTADEMLLKQTDHS